jgi:hypothetical protein
VPRSARGPHAMRPGRSGGAALALHRARSPRGHHQPYRRCPWKSKSQRMPSVARPTRPHQESAGQGPRVSGPPAPAAAGCLDWSSAPDGSRAVPWPPHRGRCRRRAGGSSRAQARTPVGREFPISALSMAERGPSPAIAHVSCALSQIPYGGFSPVRLQAEASPRSTLPCPFQA